jgi:hypothetical protein
MAMYTIRRLLMLIPILLGVTEQCSQNPSLQTVAANHQVACWEREKTEGVWGSVQ